ncbi:hypothetical protein Ndes2437A_g01919 [Nannochloris sp. 'desiccata']
MHTFWQRTNALGTYAATVLAIMCIAATFTDHFHVSNPKVSLEYLGAEGLKKQKAGDRAYPVFKLDADLRSEFSWNTKQLFVFAQIEFSSPRSPLNQMIFWNTIIQRKENAKLMISKLRPIYPFTVTDQESLLRGREFNVTVAWHVMPKVGALYKGSKTFSGFQMPEEYFEMQKDVIRPAGGAGAAAEE